jgi:large subunit ribosomal protein L29
MNAEEIRQLSDADVRAKVAELQEEQFRLKFRSATETLEQPLRLRTIRRDIARLQTVLRERELAAAGPRPSALQRRRANRKAAARATASTPAAKKRGASRTGSR